MPTTSTHPGTLPTDLPNPGAPVRPPAQSVNDRRLIEPAQPPKQVNFTIHVLLDDFPIDIGLTGSVDQLKATIARLKELGAVPPAARAAVEAENARTAPICEFHGPLTASTKAPGTWYCTKKMGDGSYCKSKA